MCPVYLLLLLFSNLATYVNIGHYSTTNFIFVIVAEIFHLDNIYPFLICNTIGVSCTWYVSLFLDKTIPTRMMEKHNWPLTEFIIGDVCLHFIPLIWAIGNMITHELNAANEISRHCGLYSFLTNMIWCCFAYHGFDPQQAYIKEPFYIWNLIWAFNAYFHIMPMLYMQSRYIMSEKNEI